MINMNKIIVFFAILSLTFVVSVSPAFQEKEKAPDSIVFESKMGKVTFDHKKHDERAKGKCETCHPKPWAKGKGALNYKAAAHKTAEAAKASCATCHVEGGMSFASKGNCAKCHVKGAAKK